MCHLLPAEPSSLQPSPGQQGWVSSQGSGHHPREGSRLWGPLQSRGSPVEHQASPWRPGPSSCRALLSRPHCPRHSGSPHESSPQTGAEALGDRPHRHCDPAVLRPTHTVACDPPGRVTTQPGTQFAHASHTWPGEGEASGSGKDGDADPSALTLSTMVHPHLSQLSTARQGPPAPAPALRLLLPACLPTSWTPRTALHSGMRSLPCQL